MKTSKVLTFSTVLSRIVARTQELEYKRDALGAETKLRQEQLEVEKRCISLQEPQMNMQLELLKAFMSSKK